MPDINDELSRCAIALLLGEPFFAHLLAGVSRQVTAEVPTLAVTVRDGQPQLLVNEDFFLKSLKSQTNRVAVLKHEVLHLVFKHLLRPLMKEDHELFNLAADLVVNQYIGKWKLPDGAVILSCYPDLKLEPERELEYYYAKLSDLLKEMQKQGFQAPSGGTGNSPAQAGGKKGRKKTPPQPPATAGDWSKTSAPQSASALEQMYGGVRHSDHSRWNASLNGGMTALGAAEAELERLVIQARDRCTGKQRGTIPGPLNQLIDAMIERRKPQVDWRRALRLFACSSRRTQVSGTMKRPSKRYGTFPGLRIRRFQKLAVVVDTSGSVGENELSLFFSEIFGMWRAGAEVTVLEADAAVQRIYPYRGKNTTRIAGGGGTCFDPALEWLRQHRQQSFDACIYLTDGCAPAPEARPPCRLLWVVTSGGETGEHLKFGRVIKLDL
ncbi:MAG: VWA-like domain-containing protein [Desulfuromonadales bacterium]